MTGSSFTHAPRGSMTPQRALRIFQAANGHCAKCSRKLSPADDWDVDHITALCNGGTDDDANLQVLCEWCHTDKTADDKAMAGKGRRMAVRHHLHKRHRQKRGFR